MRAAASADPRIEWLGWTETAEMQRLMGHAACLVVPSTWYEGWPLVAIEAMGQGTPVVATAHGAFNEMVVDGVSGALIPRGDSRALAGAVRSLLHDPEERASIRRATWELFHARFTREINYRQLRTVYDDALAHYRA